MADTAAVRQQHATWLTLIETGGPFLTLPVLTTVLAQGLDPVRKPEMDRLRLAWSTWDAEQHGKRGDRARDEWIEFVVRDLLNWQDDAEFALPAGKWEHVESEFGAVTAAAFALNDPERGRPAMLGFTVPAGTSLTARSTDGWAASALDRVAVTLREHDVPLGVLTDGRWWGLVWAPRDGATAHALWDSVLWIEDRVTLEAFATLLGRRRTLGVVDAHTLLGMLKASLDSQEEVTDQLGKQVRAAVETLVDTISRADERARADHQGAASDYLTDVDAEEVYEAAVTVLMRLVFMLAAEERRLLPADDELYARSYGVAALGEELDRRAADDGEDALEHGVGGWHRLLAAFRVVHDGADHHEFRLPGYGGGLFDPDRHPWLEGRLGERVIPPLAVDDRTVRRVIRSLMWLEFRDKGVRESRRVTYRALDVEQIGYVYEGLLDHNAVRTESWVLGFGGANEPEIPLDELTASAASRGSAFADWLAKRIGKPTKWVTQRLGAPADPAVRDALWRSLLPTTDGDERQASLILPFAQMLRTDQRDLPVVIPPGRLYVTSSSARSETGTHYTPRALAESVVARALDPLLYRPGPLESLEGPWSLVPPDRILALRVADIAMGSGAFLVASCRYLADRLMESVLAADPDSLDGETATLWLLLQEAAAPGTADVLTDEAVVHARRLVADSCLFGSDINSLAVEMAKLSLWLITSAQNRPFTFLDHRLVAGDALLGLRALDQVESLHLVPAKGRRLHRDALRDETAHARTALAGAAAVRSALASRPTHDLRDVEVKQQLLDRADAAAADVALIADAVCAAAVSSAELSPSQADGRFADAAMRVTPVLGDVHGPERDRVASVIRGWLNHGQQEGQAQREPLHWVTRFPEVFADPRDAGFDAIVGNPPFLGGKKLSGALGTAYRQYLIKYLAGGKKGNADLVAFFLLRAHELLRSGGCTGLIATNTVAQGDTRDVGLQQLLDHGVTVYAAVKSEPWPSRSANLEFSVIHTAHRTDAATVPRTLDGEPVRGISSSLDPEGRVSGRPFQLASNSDRAFMGTNVNGAGFILDAQDREALLRAEPSAAEVISAFIGGEDLNKTADDDPVRWVIDFRDMTLASAERYPKTLALVRERVKPHRDTLPDSKRRVRDNWWLHEARAVSLYRALGNQEKALVMAQTSNTGKAVWRGARGRLFGHTTVVFAPADDRLFGIVNSELHYWWMARYGPTMRTDLRYVPSDVYETFPLPGQAGGVPDAARRLNVLRADAMRTSDEGMTKLYARLHDPTAQSDVIQGVRDAHAALDEAVCAAYGWSDLRLDYGFHLSRRGTRWTFSTDARLELYDRLLELNHERHAAETGQSALRSHASLKAATDGPTLFDQEAS